MNLTEDLSQLVDQLEPIARPGGQGRALMVMGASRGAGASTVARELARLAARRSHRGVWLFDLDFANNAQSEAARVDAQSCLHVPLRVEARYQAAQDPHHWGVPLMVFEGEAFFGQDRLDVLEWRLAQSGIARRAD